MSATMVAKSLSGGHGDRALFADLDLTVGPRDVVGVVGANGAGKSTLLRLLAGEQEPLEGTITTAPSDAFIGWLPQEQERVTSETVAQCITRRTGVLDATCAMEVTADALAQGAPGADDAYAAALEHWLASGGADLGERIAPTLADLGLDAGPDALMTELSGGQAARVGLAALLLSRFDLVLLDEPTNDLDLAGLERLEAFVRDLRSAVVLVSHDREFLARTVTTIVDLDLAQNTVRVYAGGYESYLEEREVARRHAREAYDDFADQKSDLMARARTQREWSSQGVRNAMKKNPDNDKIRRRASQESSEKQAQKVRQMESRIARLEEVQEPRKEWVLNFRIAAAPRSSSVVATLNEAVVHHGEAHEASKAGVAGVAGVAGAAGSAVDRAVGAGDGRGFTLGPVSLQVGAGERIGITGPNGAGKTTLLRLLLGQREPDAGSASLGASVAIGTIDQLRTTLPPDRPLGEAFGAALPELTPEQSRTLLAKFGLRARQVSSTVARLSPGERTRAALALLQARGVNLLVLDEPTNHLDLPAIEQLEEALDSYEGALLLVTHDRRLLDTVRLDRRWHVARGTVTEL